MKQVSAVETFSPFPLFSLEEISAATDMFYFYIYHASSHWPHDGWTEFNFMMLAP